MNKKTNIDKMRPELEHKIYYKMLEECGFLFYNKFNDNFIEISCPACGYENKNKVFKKYGFTHNRCQKCLTLFCSPRPTDEDLVEYYTKFESALYLREILLKTDIDRKVIQHLSRTSKIIKELKIFFNDNVLTTADIGAGTGSFSRALKDSNFFKKVIAFDFNEECVMTCNRNGIEAYQGSINRIEDNSIGLLTMNDLVEHLSSPLFFLKKCYSKIISNGMIFITTPNGEGFDFKILNDKTVNITPPEHLNYFNPNSIKILMKRAGFKIVKVGTPGILDIEIVKREVDNGNIKLDEYKYLKYLLYDTSSLILNSFQNFLKENLLSSHMFVLAQKI
jgi:2-polyprenyl-3-methyl-5-hydroxy-6-metoxy-1,4-benzoquinol methylase